MSRFEKGQSGNPGGRPKGARNKFGGRFVEALSKDFDENGEACIKRVREENPSAYLKVCAQVIPREIELGEDVGIVGFTRIERVIVTPDGTREPI